MGPKNKSKTSEASKPVNQKPRLYQDKGKIRFLESSLMYYVYFPDHWLRLILAKSFSIPKACFSKLTEEPS